MRTTTLIAICISLLSVVACGGGGSCSTGLGAIASGSGACNTTEVNTSPVANAGTDYAVVIGTKVVLDRGKSSDAENDKLTYAWALTSLPTGSKATLSSATDTTPNFTADLAGTYTATLVVNDGRVGSNEAKITITAEAAPVADPGAVQSVLTGATVILDGSKSSSSNNGKMSYQWVLTSKPTDSKATLPSVSVPKLSFVADVAGTYRATLVINDGLLESPPAGVTVTAADVNAAPVANAGISGSVLTGSKVTLQGSGTDANHNDVLTYLWTSLSAPHGSNAVLSNPKDPKPNFTADVAGNYTATLVVNDGKLDSNAVQVVITATDINVAPVADAGVPQNVLTGSTVLLDGRNSKDVNNDSLTYQWALLSVPFGSNAVLTAAIEPKASFKADLDGDYVISLVVKDGRLNSNPAQVTVTAATVNVAPVANAGLAQSVLTGSKVTLDGSKSTDANNDTLTYRWTLLSVPGGSTATLSSSADSKPTFIANVAGTYVANLIVNDGQVNSAAQQVTVAAAIINAAPVANAGLPQNVLTGSSVTLDGTKSTDANKDLLTYKWVLLSKPPGSTAQLSSDTAAKPTLTTDAAGTYVISLVVNDGKDTSGLVATSITATVGNAAPVADPGENKIVAKGALVTLDGSGSSDANHDVLTYRWTLLAKPTNSTAVLSSTSAAKPTFTADLPGTYVASLVVNDGKDNSAAVSVAVTSNAAPVAVPGLDQTVKKGALVKLDGSKSTDANNDTLTYRWELMLKPVNSVAALSSN